MIVLTSAKKSLITCTGAFLCALLAGCGGGGGGTAGGGRLSDPCSTSSPTCDQTFARLRGTAATTVPTAGGQSSNPGTVDASLDVDSSSGVQSIAVTRTDTSGAVNVPIEIPLILQEAGLNTVTVTVTAGEHIYSEQVITFSTVDISVLYFSYRAISGQNLVIIEAASDYQPSKTTSGGVTTYATDSDYLVAGIWAVIGRNPADFEYGVFVDGNDPFDRASISPLTGTATYIGRAEAELSDPGNTCNTCLLTASVTLIANFGAANVPGSISGKIVNIEGRDSDDTPFSIPDELTLGQAMISETEGGFFSGDTQLTYEGTLYEGKWGGKFYGNPNPGDPAGTHPGSAGGTFGGKATGEAAFIGYFISYL